MIINFTLKNYRSFKEKTTLSFEATGSKSKMDNIAIIKTKNGNSYRILKTAAIYGANASGKSNVIKAFWAFRNLIATSFRYDVNDEIILAEPFELDTETIVKPTEFTLKFIASDKQLYIYHISFSRKEGIINETLKYYPEKKSVIIFNRRGRQISLRNPLFFKETETSSKINPKRLYLSELGNSGEIYWEKLRNEFTLNNSIINSSARGMHFQMTENAKRVFANKEDQIVRIKNAILKLIKYSDFGIKDMELIEENEFIRESGNILNETEGIYGKPNRRKKFKTYHDVYNKNVKVDKKEFDLLDQESVGTFAMVGLSTEILLSLNFGTTLWVDELDNSLHPHLCRFLISLYNHPKTNPNNSQLIFVTHETTLLDRNNFRKDQIWLTSKDKYGVSKLYSIYDTDVVGLRDDIPFDKWYLSGKFGGLPKIKEQDFIFDRD